MLDQRVYLKVKIKSLAEEAKIIRKEEKKNDRFFYWLRLHRIKDVRSEARAAHLAYGFLRQRAYKQVESKTHEKPNWTRVKQLVSKYGVHSHDEDGNWIGLQKQDELRKELLETFDIWKKA